MQRATDLPGGAFFDGSATFAPIAKMKPYTENPRDPADTMYDKSAEFRTLVGSIEMVGVNTPLQVFWLDGAFQVIAGHRRLAAIAEINRQRMQAWGGSGRKGPSPELIENVPVSIQKPPSSEYERHVAMWNAEETKASWPESRKFKFFCATYENAPPPLRTDVKQLARELGMQQSTVRTYISLLEIPTLREAMGDPSELKLPRQGRHKTLRAVQRLTEDLSNYRPSAVRLATSNLTPSDPATKDLIAAKLLNKVRAYARNTELGIGPGVAMERTVPLMKPDHAAQATDTEVAAWLSDESVLRKEIIEQRSSKQANDGDDDESDSGEPTEFLALVRALPIRQRPGRLDEGDLQAYIDDVTAAADYLYEQARRARSALQSKISR